MEASEKKGGRAIWIGAALAFTAVIVTWCFSCSVIEALYAEMVERGQFGDQFGAINALFSGLAFAGVIVAIMLQREELKLQRKELADTREVFQRQAEAQEKQEAAIERQRRATLLSAAIDAHTANLQDIAWRIQTNSFGFHSVQAGFDAHVEVRNELTMLLAHVKQDLGL